MKILPQKLRGGRAPLLALAASSFLLFIPLAQAQGILTVTPGRTVSTSAGNGTVGYTGDNAAATAAMLAYPSAVAYDASGNLFLADANNHVIREVSTTGTITTVAGTGIEGFSGDGATATAAQFDTPTGIAVDASGNLYIADSHNHRIRKISAGIITTIAGTGAAGFAGDTAAATSAQLSLPSAVAVDPAGNVYIADTNNHRIRKVSSGTITTIAGDGEELFAGDGSAATAAALDSPTGVAVDTAGNVYIADRLNHRIRIVTATSGVISTLAGSGAASFSGGFSGDGANSTAATLSRPSGVSVDSAGNIYVADTDNQRIRQIGGGAIATVQGTGAQGFSGDGGLSTTAVLNNPKSVAPDSVGNLSTADKLNARVRSGLLPSLTFPSIAVGVPTATQPVTLANSGTAAITVSTITVSTGFTAATGGSCSTTPITLAAGSSCTQNLESLPVASGPDSGSVVFSGTGVVPQKVLLAGTAVPASTTTSLTAAPSSSLVGQPVFLASTVTPIGIGIPTGTITFLDSNLTIATSPLVSGSTAVITTTLPVGSNPLTAKYSGDTNYTTSTSPTVNQLVEDFTLTLTPQPGNPAGSTDQTVIPGQTATFDLALTPVAVPFTYPIVMSVTGLPPGATATFTPTSATPGSSPAPVIFTIKTILTGSLRHDVPGGGNGIVFALLLLPFWRPTGRRVKKGRLTKFALLLLLSLGALGSMTGCGFGSGLFGQPQKIYNITVTGTATGTNGYTLQHSTSFNLTVQ